MALDFVQRIHITRVTHGFIPVAFKQQRRISPVFAAHADAKRAAVTESIGYVDFKQRRNQCRFSENILRAGNRWQSRQGVCRLFSPEYDLCLTFIMVTERQKDENYSFARLCGLWRALALPLES